MARAARNWREPVRTMAHIYRWAGLVYTLLCVFLVPLGVLSWWLIFVPAFFFLIAAALDAAARCQAASPAVVPAVVAPELLVLAAPGSSPGQCRVCGLDDLAWWMVGDEVLELFGPDAHVVAYGSGRAHRDCAAVRPYQRTAIERFGPSHELDHHGDPSVFVLGCPLCGDEINARQARQATPEPPTQSAAVHLEQRAEAGDWHIVVDRDPGRGTFRLGSPVDAGRFDVVTVVAVAPSPYGPACTASLYGPIRRSYDARSGVVLEPISEDRLFNRETGRPYTHIEQGMACDCTRCVAALAESAVDRQPCALIHTYGGSPGKNLSFSFCASHMEDHPDCTVRGQP